MNNLSPIKKIIISSVVFALIALLLVILGIVPLFGKIGKISSEIVSIKKDLALFEEDAKKAEHFEENYNSLEITPEKTTVFLVPADAPIEIINFFEDLAKEEELELDISPIAVSKTGQNQENSIGFETQVFGEFANVMKFLEKAETSHYFIEVQKVYLKKISAEDLNSKKYSGLALGQIVGVLDFKVFTK